MIGPAFLNNMKSSMLNQQQIGVKGQGKVTETNVRKGVQAHNLRLWCLLLRSFGMDRLHPKCVCVTDANAPVISLAIVLNKADKLKLLEETEQVQ